MTTRRQLGLMFSMALLAVGPVAVAADRPNILLAISDDQSYPHASAYGSIWCGHRHLTAWPDRESCSATPSPPRQAAPRAGRRC